MPHSVPNTYAIVGGTLWGNRGAEAMVVTTIGRVRRQHPDAAFAVMSYQPRRDADLVEDSQVKIIGYAPRDVVVSTVVAAISWLLRRVKLDFPMRVAPRSISVLRDSKVLLDVSGISFHDGRLGVSIYNFLCLAPAFMLGVPVVRLSQAMGPFESFVNRILARWALRKSAHSFARGRATAELIDGLIDGTASWSVAPDIAFGYEEAFSLTVENESRVGEVRSQIDDAIGGGGRVAAIVPSSLVYKKSTERGVDYTGLLVDLCAKLQASGFHVVFVPNATSEGSTTLRNNDIAVIGQLRRDGELTGRLDPARASFVEFDINTASIRSLLRHADIVITSRFHAMVAALSLGVPTLVLGWSHKYQEVLEMFGCEEFAIDFVDGPGSVDAPVDDLLAKLDLVRSGIGEALPAVRLASQSQFEGLDDRLIG